MQDVEDLIPLLWQNPTSGKLGGTGGGMADAAIREAFDRLTETFSSEDIGDFQSTTLQDVQNAAQAIERRQSQRQSLQNLRRIQPFLEFMQRYTDVLEVICQGYSPIAWVWVSNGNPG